MFSPRFWSKDKSWIIRKYPTSCSSSSSSINDEESNDGKNFVFVPKTIAANAAAAHAPILENLSAFTSSFSTCDQGDNIEWKSDSATMFLKKADDDDAAAIQQATLCDDLLISSDIVSIVKTSSYEDTIIQRLEQLEISESKKVEHVSNDTLATTASKDSTTTMTTTTTLRRSCRVRKKATTYAEEFH